MSPIAITLIVLGVAIVAFMSNKVAVGIVSLGVAISLWATGILTLNEALAGFGEVGEPGELPGVAEAKVHFNTGRIEVAHDPAAAPLEALVSAVKSAGYTARPAAF